MVDGDLPEEIEQRLSNSEKVYFKKHVDNLQSYIKELDLNLCLVNNFILHKFTQNGKLSIILITIIYYAWKK